MNYTVLHCNLMNYITSQLITLHCTMRSLYSISISQPNKLGPILKVAQCDII